MAENNPGNLSIPYKKTFSGSPSGEEVHVLFDAGFYQILKGTGSVILSVRCIPIVKLGIASDFLLYQMAFLQCTGAASVACLL